MPPLVQTLPDITEAFLILAEGAGDEALVRSLCANRGIDGFQIEDARGNTRIGTHVHGLLGRRGSEDLKAVIIVADSEDSPEASFQDIRKQLRKAKVPCSHKPFHSCHWPSVNFATYVVMLPFNGTQQAVRGSLETLLLPAATQHLSQYTACVDRWCECLEISKLSKPHQDKVKLRSLLAAAHPEDPNVGLQYAVSPTKKLIPLDHPCFDPLADLLLSVRRMYEA